MQREDVLAIFPEATSEQIDSFLNAHHGELTPAKNGAAAAAQLQAQLEAARQRESELSAQLTEAQRQAQQGMTAEEQLAALQAEAEAQRLDFTLKTNALDARQAFISAGCFDPDTIESLVAQVTVEDHDATVERAKAIVDTVEAQRKAVEESVRDELLKSNPSLQGSGNPNPALKWDDFKKMSYKEQLAYKQDNPEAFSQMMKH